MRADYPEIVKGISTQDGVVTSFTISSTAPGFEPWSTLPAREVKFYARNSTQHITCVGDFDGVDTIDNLTVLKSSAGAGTMPSWTVGDPIAISFALLGDDYSKFLDFLGDKSVLTPIFAVGFGQSKWVPYPALDTGSLPNNPDVESWDSDGAQVYPAAPTGYSFKQLNPNASAYDDYNSSGLAQLYTGHPRGGRGGTFLGWADFVQRFRGSKVKIVWTHWGGASMSVAFNPFVASGTGYNEFVGRVKDAMAADSSLPTFPDFYFQRIGWTDAAILGMSTSYFVENHFRFERQLLDAGIIGPDTTRVFFEWEDEVNRTGSGAKSVGNFSYYKTVAALHDKAILVPLSLSTTNDHLHKDGNAQLLDGVTAAKACLLMRGPKQLPPGQNYIRPTKTVQFWADYIATAESQPTNLNNEFNTNGAATVVRFPLAARDAEAGVDDSYGFTHLDQVRAEEFWDGTKYCFRFHVEEAADPASYCDYEITVVNGWSDSLPDTADKPNNREFTCTAVDDGVNWPPTAGTECAITLQRWDGDSWEDALVYADDNSVQAYVNHSVKQGFFAERPDKPSTSTAWGTDGAVPVISTPAVIREDNAVLDAKISGRRSLEGRSEVISDWSEWPDPPNLLGVLMSIKPDTTRLGVMKGKITLVGHRIDGSPAVTDYYSAAMEFTAHFHTAGDVASNVHITRGPVIEEIDPGAQTWDTELVGWPAGTGGYSARNVNFRSPARDGQTWVWDWYVDYIFHDK